MRDLLIAIAAAVAARGTHADAAYPKSCFSPPIGVSVDRTKSTLDFTYESLADQPFTVAVSSSQQVKFEAYRTFPTVFKTADDGVELLEPNRSYLVP